MNQITGVRAVRAADVFLLEWYDGIRISTPESASKEHGKIAAELASAINKYECAKDEYNAEAQKAKLDKTKTKEWFDQMAKHPRIDLDPLEAEISAKFVTVLRSGPLNLAWEKRVNAARELRACINNALAHGILSTGDNLLSKLKECEEERQRLSKQMAEYKRARISSIKRHDSEKEGQH